MSPRRVSSSSRSCAFRVVTVEQVRLLPPLRGAPKVGSVSVNFPLLPLLPRLPRLPTFPQPFASLLLTVFSVKAAGLPC